MSCNCSNVFVKKFENAKKWNINVWLSYYCIMRELALKYYQSEKYEEVSNKKYLYIGNSKYEV